nr:protein CHROMATIN REMODELING 35-like [Ipomoea batatas]
MYVGVEDDSETEDGNDANFDGLDDIWNEMSFAIECSKVQMFTVDASSNKDKAEDEDEECEHSFILKEDIGYVCRICGVIKKSIESIIDYQYSKSAKNARTYRYEGRTTKDSGPSENLFEPNKPSHEFELAEISAHPRHKKQDETPPNNRAQQLEVLKQWAGERSVLFLGYKQFSVIVCDNEASRAAVACQEILLTVQTPRKVVLSGTLYQNHVKEVFNILNLVRPKFLKLEDSKAIKRRILSRAEISSKRNLIKKGSDNEFFELVEHTLLKDENVTRKATVIQDLREMTRKVLHYYKGDFLEELPGLVDFTVILKLHPKQKIEVAGLKNLRRKFKISAEGSALYVHPQLKSLSKTSVKERIDEQKIDMIVDNFGVTKRE